MSGEVARVTQGSLAMPEDVMARLAQAAKDASAKERPAISRISLRAGVMSYGGNALPNNKMEAVVMAAAFRNVWYAGSYDPDNIVNPNCFALNEDDSDMAPHENVTNPVHPTCKGCPNNEWGSAPPRAGKPSRGKACKQTRRLVLLPGHAVEKGPDDVLTAEMAVLDVPVTSVRYYSQFVNTLAATANVPPYAAVTEVQVVPDVKTMIRVNFKPMRMLPSVEVLEAIQKRLPGALVLAIEPYDETANADAPTAPATPTKTSKKF